MKYLIDTHILIWHGEDNPALKPSILSILNNPAIDLFVSHASLWEMAIKVSIGKLELGYPIEKWEELLSQNGFVILPFDYSHYQALSTLPFHHNDPFDRMIIAQAMTEKIEIITRDRAFKNYGVGVVWA